jgi:predicted transposase YbfD/YdcC
MYIALFIFFGLLCSLHGFEQTLRRSLSRKKSLQNTFILSVKDPLAWENAIKKSWNIENGDGTFTEWFKLINGTKYYVNKDGIREIHKKQ